MVVGELVGEGAVEAKAVGADRVQRHSRRLLIVSAMRRDL
jgi:hypothetical protein